MCWFSQEKFYVDNSWEWKVKSWEKLIIYALRDFSTKAFSISHPATNFAPIPSSCPSLNI